MKLAIGLLLASGFPVPVPFMLSFVDLWTRLVTNAANDRLPPHLQITGVQLFRSEGFPIDAARNDIVREFLKSSSEALLFLDADMRHPADLPERLLRHDVDVVTGLYFMRRWPYQATAMVAHPTQPGVNQYKAVHVGRGLQPIDVGGAGCLLIRRHVLEAIAAAGGENWFRYQRDPKPPHEFTVSEDFAFYQQAAACGYQPYCDFDTVSTHVAVTEVTREVHDAAVKAQIDGLMQLEPAARAEAMRTIVVRGYPEGLVLPDGSIATDAGVVGVPV